jgi:pimeloyl-ACP methyl ester carboxylesterase
MRAPLAVRTVGSGPPLLLVHGGVGPRVTWAAQEPLAARWRLLIPWRRGFGDSPSTDRQDFDDDAADLAALLEAGDRPHAVGFSYGGVGLLLAAGAAPGSVRSLTLIEPPLFGLADGHPDVAALALLSSAYASGGGDGDAVAEFERLAGVSGAAAAGLGAELDEARRLARGMRQPDEADPDLVAINAAGVPALVVSGGHHPGLEAVCDELAGRLAAHRERVEGAGHAAQRAPGFNDVLERFLRSAEQAA